MAKKTDTNGTTTVTLSGSDFDTIAALGEQLRDAANPADDFDPEANMRRIIGLNAKVAKLREAHDQAKRELKDTIAAERVVRASEKLKVALTELDDFLAEMGREYPLFQASAPN